MTTPWEPTEVVQESSWRVRCKKCRRFTDTLGSSAPRTPEGEPFCSHCHDEAHATYLKGCPYCEGRANVTNNTKHMRPGARAVENTKRVAILAGILAVLVGIGAITLAIEGGVESSSSDAEYRFACASVRDYASGGDVSDILSDLQSAINRAKDGGGPYGTLEGAYEVVAFGSDSEVENWLDACSGE